MPVGMFNATFHFHRTIRGKEIMPSRPLFSSPAGIGYSLLYQAQKKNESMEFRAPDNASARNDLFNGRPERDLRGTIYLF
ncbi:MAG: hypothetical protein A2Y33_15780 [Spirochaetes bacterium GWF1_51_8]|nr:MAG: hypothetical protein A2Y33_15780 [Spirochaetes bacterium GWF1_51_8]